MAKNKILSPYRWLKQIKFKIPEGATYIDNASINTRQCAAWISEYNGYISSTAGDFKDVPLVSLECPKVVKSDLEMLMAEFLKDHLKRTTSFGLNKIEDICQMYLDGWILDFTYTEDICNWEKSLTLYLSDGSQENFIKPYK